MRRFLKASYTVEAALLIPIIIAALLLLLYTSCFLYDTCLLERGVRSVTLKGLSFEGSHEECECYMRQEWEKLTKKRLLGSRIEKTDITANGVVVSIVCETSSRLTDSYRKLFARTYKKTRLVLRGADLIRAEQLLQKEDSEK